MDTVAQPLTRVICSLKQHNIQYTLTVTQPSRATFQLLDDSYVVRQQLGSDGVYHLVVAAKMGKEVF